jgi:two-component system sensor histidine kinase CpxA
MRARLSLPAKIVLVALLNFLVLVAVFLAFLRTEYRFDPQNIVRLPTIDRILATSRLFELELAETPVDERPELLQRYTETYGVDFYLFDGQGNSLIPPGPNVPDEVRERMRQGPFRGPGRGREIRGTVAGPMPDGQASGSQARSGRGGRGVGAGSLTYARTDNPRQYWVMVRMPIRFPGGERRPAPGLLVMSSDSILGNGFFFDPTPWIIVIVAVIGISVLVWLPFIRGLTKTVSQMTLATQRIADGEFEEHIESKRHDELGQLAGAINRMSVRLGGFVKGQKRFLADIAHELSSPVARMQFALGILERRADQSQRESVTDLQDELQHMSGLINELLQFSKAGMQTAPVKLERVNVEAAVKRALERESKDGIVILTEIDPDLSVLADAEYLSRAISNLIRNAVRYAGEAGPIQVSARRDGHEVVINVADSGPGLPEEALEDVFAPFYRPEAARNRETGGVGLGLAIVRSCIEACKGTVHARNRQPSGLEVEIRLEG